MIYLQLFWSFFQIGLFSIGGGYAALPLIQTQVVQVHSWITMNEFNDLITISQMTPGPIAINSATFVGNQIAGLGGAIISTLGCIMPSCIIVSILAYLYFKYKNMTILQGILTGLRPAVVALIASAGLTIFITAIWGESIQWETTDITNACLFIMAMVMLRKFKADPTLTMISCGCLSVMIYLVF